MKRYSVNDPYPDACLLNHAACRGESAADRVSRWCDHNRRVSFTVAVVDEALRRPTAASPLVPEAHGEGVVVAVRVDEERDL